MKHRMIQLLLALVPAAALAQTPSKVLVATGKEVIREVVSPGSIECVGGTPGTNPQGPPCSPDTKRVLIWNHLGVAEEKEVTGSAAALVQGTVHTVVHCVMDANLYGSCYGTFELTVPGAEGQWKGAWSGMFDMLTNTNSYQGTGWGYGGKLEGLQIRGEWATTGPDQATVFIAKITGN